MKKVISMMIVAVVVFAYPVCSSAAKNETVGYPCPLDPTLTCVMSALDGPRGLEFGPEGALYVAEAGRGAGVVADPSQDPACFDFQGAVTCYGPTGAVTRLWHGAQEKFATGLPSIAGANGNRARGPNDISFQGRGGAYVTIGLEADPRIRTALPALPDLAGLATLAHVSASGEWRLISDLGAFEIANNPDGGINLDGSPNIDSDPYGILALPGERIITEAGANVLLREDANGEVSLLATFPCRGSVPPRPSFAPKQFNATTDSVPTTVVIGPDGALYIGELTGVPFVDGKANIYRLDPEAEIPHAFTLGEAFLSGFKMILDMAFDDDGTLYVLEHATGAVQQTGLGVLIRVVPDKNQFDLRDQYTKGTRSTVIGNLVRPTSVAIGPDHELYVTNRGLTAGGGEVIRIDR